MSSSSCQRRDTNLEQKFIVQSLKRVTKISSIYLNYLRYASNGSTVLLLLELGIESFIEGTSIKDFEYFRHLDDSKI